MKLADHMEDERTARMALSMIAEPDDAVTGRVLALVGAVETVRLIESEDIVPFLDRVDAMIWRESLNARVDDRLLPALDEARQSGFGVLIPSDVDWPAGVNDLHVHAPYVLWTLGDEALLGKRPRDLVTITGSRAATTYGERVAGEFATDFAASGRVVVAGGTYGIEGAAHRGALARDGRTVAVLAGGLDRPYPAGHRGLLERIGDAGLLVSELPPGATPTRHRFAARSRLMAAMAGATVLVEASGRSASLGTARHARGLGRVVGAVPGPVTSAASVGPHQLIAANQAALTSNAQPIIDALETRPPRSRPELTFSQDRKPPTTGYPARPL